MQPLSLKTRITNEKAKQNKETKRNDAGCTADACRTLREIAPAIRLGALHIKIFSFLLCLFSSTTATVRSKAGENGPPP